MRTIYLDYKKIEEMHNEGLTYTDVWHKLRIPAKYPAFEQNIMHWKRTGQKRRLRVTMDNLAKRNENVVISDEYYDKPLKVEPIEIELSKDDILQMLKKGCAISKIPGGEEFIKKIVEEGYCVQIDVHDNAKLMTNIPKTTNIITKSWDKSETHIKIGIVSDTHIGNVNTQMTFLNRLYDVFEQHGIKDVYHCGDLSDGWYPNRSDQVYELFAHGADRQVDYIVDNYPKRDGITTHFILGNHDYTFVRNTGYNIGPAIALRRPDMKYLGLYNARVWLTPNCDMEMNHPGDGSAYAMSYSIQKYIDSISGGDKPKILLNGHHHKFLTMFYRNVHAIEVPCTEAQTMFMKSKRLAAHMGGLILNIIVDEDGTIVRFNTELVPLYKSIDSDY